jgi:hypothetical protein
MEGTMNKTREQEVMEIMHMNSYKLDHGIHINDYLKSLFEYIDAKYISREELKDVLYDLADLEYEVESHSVQKVENRGIRIDLGEEGNAFSKGLGYAIEKIYALLHKPKDSTNGGKE